jgi:Flp pilus assembly protein TadD
MADRFTYVPLIGVFVMTAWGARDLLGRWRRRAYVLAPAAACVMAACMALSAREVRYWADSMTLFSRALEVNENNFLAHSHLAVYLDSHGRTQEAIGHLEKSLQINSYHTHAYDMLGSILNSQGRFAEAVAYGRQAVEIEPNLASGHTNLGVSLGGLGRTDEAIAQHLEAIRLDPDMAGAYNNLAVALIARKDYQAAVVSCRDALRLRPDLAETHNNLAYSLEMLGDAEGAIAHYRAAMELKPDTPVILNNLARILAMGANPNYRDGAAAVPLAERACRLTGLWNPGYLDTLAAAYAAAGRFEEAVRTAEEARRLALAMGAKTLAAAIGDRLELYRSGRSYSEPPIRPQEVQ